MCTRISGTHGTMADRGLYANYGIDSTLRALMSTTVDYGIVLLCFNGLVKPAFKK